MHEHRASRPAVACGEVLRRVPRVQARQHAFCKNMCTKFRIGSSLTALVLLLAPESLHGDSPPTVSGRVISNSPVEGGLRGVEGDVRCDSSTALLMRGARDDVSEERMLAAGVSQLRLRGGKGNLKTGRSKSVTRSGSPLRSASVQKASKKKPMKPHNLGPAEWMKKLKHPKLQRQEVSMKGFARGRKKAVFHFWTKSRIKDFTQKRIAFRAKRRERRAMTKRQLEGNNKAEIIRAWARGWKTKFSKWLPSAAEQRAIDEVAAREASEAAKKALAEKEAAGDAEEEGGGEDGDGEDAEMQAGGEGDGDAGAADDEEDDFMGGFGGGDSDGSGLF